MKDFSLYVITGEQFYPERNYLEVIEEAINGGADIVQLREKKKTKRELLDMAKHLKDLCVRYDVPFIVNDHVDIALAVDADGVHLGQDDLPLEEARKILGPDKIIGISTHKLEEAKRAEEGGADYIGVGPVFPTITKEDVVDPVGLEYVREVVAHIRIPFVAIGGIKLHNVDQVLEAGAERICIVSAIVGAEDVQGAARAFASKIKQVRK
ncbi:thiamine-phosphate pyrophosphorylase [Caldalkalibacillus uzonensis]|uniref:Thiamine-phosphate synthase n=1 Tax=Caldalkalibacillus uzonensis TaxID=353224 RepID=A0ABU0CVB4_9BACI|nr:thiamine phosphate synthase [Caldalkalibacillus uzonensis]MDQ0340343.1 thiamine-phosphate pyrophosphorylase [Caldalkalibacillus uzonensis]